MDYHIHDKRLIEVVYKFLSGHKKPKVVCNYMIDYDYDFDRLVVNIFFKKNADPSYETLVVDEVIDSVTDYFQLRPLIYTHIGDC